MLQPRTVIQGFEIQGVIRSGPRGPVYEAIQGSLLRPVAFRILAPWLSRDTDFVKRFWRQEWPDHSHIVPVYEAGECEYGLFLAMQLIRGETLAEVIAREGLTEPSGLVLLTQIASALDAAHESGVAHGWVRPEAVLVDGNGRAWLSDFGLTPGTAEPAADRAAFAALARTCFGKRSVPKGRWETAGEVVEAVMAKRRGSAEGREGGPLRRVRRRVQPRRGTP